MDTSRFTFEDLEVWQLSRELRRRFSVMAKDFPAEERFRLADQMIRASRSVTANLAEGYGRYHYQENIQYCRHARGSLYELIDHLIVAMDEKYIQRDVFIEVKTSILTIIRKLNGYIRYLSNQKTKHKD